MAEDEIYPVPKPTSKEIGLDIVVPTYGRLELTIKCINSIYVNTQTPFHLIVTHSPDSPEDLTEEWMNRLMQRMENITFVRRDSWTTGNEFFNAAFNHAKTDYIATVMNSVSVEPEWEVVALDILKRQPDVGIVGLKCLFGDLTRCYGAIESAGINMNGYTPFDVGRDFPGHRLNGVYECEATQWAFALLRKQAVVGNLDLGYNGFVGWDDIDNCFEVKKKGWKILYCGMGAGYHNTRATRGDSSEDAQEKNRENAHRFYKKWGYWDLYCETNKLDKATGEPPTNGNRAARRKKVKK